MSFRYTSAVFMLWLASATVLDSHVYAQVKGDGGKASPDSLSHIQIVYPASDIVTSGDCQSSTTTVVIRGMVENLHGPIILGGELEDKDSHARLSSEAFQLVRGTNNCDKDSVVLQNLDTDIPTTALTTVHIHLKPERAKAGSYMGVLRIAAKEDTLGQDVKFNVSVRPWFSWWLGILFIAVGSVISWLGVVYAVRQRQMAGNQILVARLGQVLVGLREQLKAISAAQAPSADLTLAHISLLLQKKLRQLLTDKEVSVLTGVTVPPVGTVTVLDEIEGVNRIVINGFSRLLNFWNQPNAKRDDLTQCFRDMDKLGSNPQALVNVDQEIIKILATAGGIVGDQHSMKSPALPGLPQEDAVVHRVVFTTFALDALSLLTILMLGVYVLIWKNPGFGSVGSLLEAFFWGIGLKLGTDAARLGSTDVRTAFGIKIPSAS